MNDEEFNYLEKHLVDLITDRFSGCMRGTTAYSTWIYIYIYIHLVEFELILIYVSCIQEGQCTWFLIRWDPLALLCRRLESSARIRPMLSTLWASWQELVSCARYLIKYSFRLLLPTFNLLAITNLTQAWEQIICSKRFICILCPFKHSPVILYTSGKWWKVKNWSSVNIFLTHFLYCLTGVKILDLLKKDDAEFVRCLHSVGTPANGILDMPSWPCDPERTIILHR